MTIKITFLVSVCILLSSCFGPRNVDYRTVWDEQGKELKILVNQIKSNGTYKWGNHDFPNNRRAIQLDNKNLMIKFYTDRGLMDHFSAFVYTNDKKEMEQLDEQTGRDKNDNYVKLEKHWYYIQH